MFITNKVSDDTYFDFFFGFFDTYRDFLKLVSKAGMLYSFLERMDIENRKIGASYESSFYAGGLYNQVKQWVNNNFDKTPSEMAEICRDIIKGFHFQNVLGSYYGVDNRIDLL